MTKAVKQVGILGVGSYLPSKILTNHDLEKMVDTSDEWIVQRTGIRTPPYCGSRTGYKRYGPYRRKACTGRCRCCPCRP